MMFWHVARQGKTQRMLLVLVTNTHLTLLLLAALGSCMVLVQQ
jgi:hypothetical protein